MNESTLVPREEMSDLDWLARNVHEWPVNAKFAVRPGMGEVLFYEHHYSHLVQFSREQVEARRAELQNKPGWGVVPSHANWLAQDAAGSWLWHSSEPECRNGGWIGSTTRGYAAKGCVLGDWRNTLEKRPEQNEFEPFVSVEDAATAKHATITTSKYTKTIHGVPVDVYDVLQAWGVINPALQHLIKKALQCGQRGHKDNAQDLQDIIDSAIRAKELG